MATLTTAPAGLEYALLGLLRAQPMHAYEMYQRLTTKEALGSVWRLKQSHLYALLAKLEDAGYLSGSTESQGTRPPRKMLALTPAGADAFAVWLRSPVAHGRDFRLEFLAKLSFALEEGPPAAAILIGEQRSATTAWLADLRARASAQRPFDQLVVEFRVSQLTAILQWLGACATLALQAPHPS